MIGTITSSEKMIELKKIRIESKYRQEAIDFFPLLPLIGLNHSQPIINIPKRMVYLYTTYEKINKLAIGYIINPSLQVDNMFR